MKDTDLLSQLPGLSEPWIVEAVELNTVEGQVDIRVAHASVDRRAGRNYAEPRVWCHLDTCQFKTFLHARILRVNCPEHGVQVNVPWAGSKGRFTLLKERKVLTVSGNT